MNLRDKVRRWLPAPVVDVWRLRRAGARQDRRHQALVAEVSRACGYRVQRGPFAGMSYAEPYWDRLPKLLGSYEEELHPTVEALAERGYDTIINVGAAEGYYAVGLGRHSPAKVITFEMVESVHGVCADLAARNGVAVDIRGECRPGDLGACVGGRTLVVMDVEGAELDLLDPAVTPELALADILVELHDFVDPSIKPTILARFADTHEVTVIGTRPRRVSDYPELAAYPVGDAARAIDEHRPGPMEWALLRSR